MRDEYELRLVAQALDHAAESAHIAFVQRSIHFIQYAERRRLHLQNGEQQCRGRQRALAAGQQRQGLRALAWRLRLNLNPALVDVFGVCQ